MFSLDTRLFLAMNGLAGKSQAFDAVVTFCAGNLIWLMAIAVLVRAAILVVRNDRRAAAYFTAVTRSAAAVSIALLGNWLFGQYLWFRERPFVALYDVHLLAVPPYGWQSFPSGHAAAAFVVAFSVYFEDRHAGTVLLVAATAVALGRVFGGVHYPLDVLVGAFAGFVWAFAARAASRRFGVEPSVAAFVKRIHG